MSCLLRSTKAKLLSSSSSLSRTLPSLSPLSDLFHRNTATMPHSKENASSAESNAISSWRYKASGLDISVLDGARQVPRIWPGQGPMLLGVNSVMAKSFEIGSEAGAFGMIGQKRFMSVTPSKTSETNPSGFRPLSPHLPLYEPQLSATLSIFNRIAGASLAAVILAFYMIYMKVGVVSFTYDSFYQFMFYSSKLNLLVMELSALAMTYHLYSAIRHLFL